MASTEKDPPTRTESAKIANSQSAKKAAKEEKETKKAASGSRDVEDDITQLTSPKYVKSYVQNTFWAQPFCLR